MVNCAHHLSSGGSGLKFEATFGALIAFLLPRFICIYGSSLKMPELAELMDGTGQTTESAGFRYTLLASLSLGLIISAIRWALLDRSFAAMGINWPDNIDWGKLNDEKKLASFQLVVQGHYHHYQYYSNTSVALLIDEWRGAPRKEARQRTFTTHTLAAARAIAAAHTAAHAFAKEALNPERTIR